MIYFRFSKSDVTQLRVRLGAHNLHLREDSAVDYGVKRVVRHKDYNPRLLVCFKALIDILIDTHDSLKMNLLLINFLIFLV